MCVSHVETVKMPLINVYSRFLESMRTNKSVWYHFRFLPIDSEIERKSKERAIFLAAAESIWPFVDRTFFPDRFLETKVHVDAGCEKCSADNIFVWIYKIFLVYDRIFLHWIYFDHANLCIFYLGLCEDNQILLNKNNIIF